MNVLVTGSNGFIGRHLIKHLHDALCWSVFDPKRLIVDFELMEFNSANDDEELYAMLDRTDIVYHLAGVNRSEDELAFVKGNVNLTKKICNYLISHRLHPKIVFASSVHAGILMSDKIESYGLTKYQAEQILFNYTRQTGAKLSIYRLNNIFGPYAKPNYNSVVATFCYNIAHDLPIVINNPSAELYLTYVFDLVDVFVQELYFEKPEDIKKYKATVGQLAEKIKSFKTGSLGFNEMSILLDPKLKRDLYHTYLYYKGCS